MDVMESLKERSAGKTRETVADRTGQRFVGVRLVSDRTRIL